MPLVSSALPPLLSTKPARCVLAILALACAHLAPPAWAAGETPGGIEGVVYNSTDGLPLGRVKVSASGAGFAPRETLTDDEGRFAFANLPPGAARLDVSYLGFDPQTAGVTIAAGATATRDFQLIREGAARGPVAPDGDVVKLERFSVVADQAMTAQALAMNEQLHAASITNVLALDELPGQGFENIGDYVRFLPGVSIIDNGESPSQISLGGFPANMSNVSIDGAGVASTGIDDVSRSGGRD
ncbi:MAG: TonB-dependent receptor, partial [Opitutaceae bacterium]|nr:TonB-dependent receptor [Opitutaceae bacterium]